jgi:hypothetical protein
MKRIFQRFLILYSLIIIIATWGAAWIETGVLHMKSLGIYPLFPSFFWVWGMLTIWLIYRIHKQDVKKALNYYMLLKTIKNVLSGIIALVIFTTVTEMREYQLMAFAMFYIINLITESTYIFSLEKQRKKEA